ncbi:natural killer cell receptor 2B4-like isoform X2 [Oncorhynchus tshawytscha]|uniref:natural killer cell receptor 2B4-like isoform X2 n=1 Tax=Oncorhynchus tshawytscha TaxID=74940 RepID=UPI001C3E7A32|nr:natural killer cell receptor 2B4-like isoform X2 [Oncorhynchus tshawytscha]
MFGCPFSSFSKQGILLILLSNLHYGVGVSSYLSFHKTVGDSVEIPAGLEGQNATIMQWKYRGKDIAEFNSEVVYSRGSQFDGRLELNVINFSLTIRKLTLQDSGEFLVTAETDKQIPTKAVTLQVHEPISKMVIQTDIKLLANHSCTVWLVCNVSCYPNLTYTWERDNEIYGDAQQIQFSLSPAEGDISVKCNASNLVSWKTASTTVKCSNDTTTPGQAWYSIYIGVSVGGAVVLILTVAVAVCYCRKHRNKDLTDNTIYADVMINTRSRDTRSNSHVNPISIYETVNDLVIPRLNKPQTLYDKITFGRREAHPSPFQEVL